MMTNFDLETVDTEIKIPSSYRYMGSSVILKAVEHVPGTIGVSLKSEFARLYDWCDECWTATCSNVLWPTCDLGYSPDTLKAVCPLHNSE